MEFRVLSFPRFNYEPRIAEFSETQHHLDTNDVLKIELCGGRNCNRHSWLKWAPDTLTAPIRRLTPTLWQRSDSNNAVVPCCDPLAGALTAAASGRRYLH